MCPLANSSAGPLRQEKSQARGDMWRTRATRRKRLKPQPASVAISSQRRRSQYQHSPRWRLMPMVWIPKPLSCVRALAGKKQSPSTHGSSTTAHMLILSLALPRLCGQLMGVFALRAQPQNPPPPAKPTTHTIFVSAAPLP